MWGPLVLKILFKVSETKSVVKSQRSCLLFPHVREALLSTAPLPRLCFLDAVEKTKSEGLGTWRVALPFSCPRALGGGRQPPQMCEGEAECGPGSPRHHGNRLGLFYEQPAKRSENQRSGGGGGGGGMGAWWGGECRFLEEPSGLRTTPSGAPSGLGGREHP